MSPLNACPLSVYKDTEPLCEKGHVVLVQNRHDGQLYVKKQIQSYTPALYRLLFENPVKNTPVLYGIYEAPAAVPAATDAIPLILIEEYLPGHTLAEHIREDGLFSQEQCIDIGMQLCRILVELHSRKPAIIHRDIKPSNVILLPDGTVYLLDFSAAKVASETGGRDTVLIGTAGYAAPEQYGFSASTPQTDIYALGVLLNVMLTGALPWEKKAGGKLGSIISRCLKMEPKSRYSGARELYAALKRVQKERVSWFLPGFRSLCWYKMIPAFIWYTFTVIFAFRADTESIDVASKICVRLIFLMLGFFPVLFYGNYLDIQRLFPLVNSQNRMVRIAGLLLAPLFLAIIMLMVCTVVTLFFIW